RLTRERVAADEAHPAEKWRAQARDPVLPLSRAAHRARATGLPQTPPEIAEFYLTLFTQAVSVGLSLHSRAAGREQSKTRTLLERLRDRADQVLGFAHDLAVPFTNNQAEVRHEVARDKWICGREGRQVLRSVALARTSAQ